MGGFVNGWSEPYYQERVKAMKTTISISALLLAIVFLASCVRPIIVCDNPMEMDKKHSTLLTGELCL